MKGLFCLKCEHTALLSFYILFKIVVNEGKKKYFCHYEKNKMRMHNQQTSGLNKFCAKQKVKERADWWRVWKWILLETTEKKLE